MRNTRAKGLFKCLLTAGCSIIIFQSCSKSAAPLNSANVSFVNGCLSAPSIGVKANNTSISGATDIPFLANSGYRYVVAGRDVYLTFYTGTGPFASRTVNIAASDNYSAFIGGTLSNPMYLFTTDDLTPPQPGKAKVRFVNLSPDNINESVATNDTLVAQGIATNTVSTFYEVKQGGYFMSPFDPGHSSTTISGDTVALVAGKIYTVMLTGTLADSGTTSGLMLTVIHNN